MLQKKSQAAPVEDLGMGLRAGDSHYRAYVGPPERYDLVAAMSFNLLTTHSGCGSIILCSIWAAVHSGWDELLIPLP